MAASQDSSDCKNHEDDGEPYQITLQHLQILSKATRQISTGAKSTLLLPSTLALRHVTGMTTDTSVMVYIMQV